MDTRTRQALDHWITTEPDPVCDCGHPIDMHDDGACPPPTRLARLARAAASRNQPQTTSCPTSCHYCIDGHAKALARLFNFDTGVYDRVEIDCPCTKGA